MFPPFMKKAPHRLSSNALWEKNQLKKRTTSLQFGYLGTVFSSLLGSLDKGGIPKVINLRGRPSTGSTWNHVWCLWEPVLEHMGTIWDHLAPFWLTLGT